MIKQSEDGLPSDKKHAVLLKPVQPNQLSHRLTLASVATKSQRAAEQPAKLLTGDTVPIADTATTSVVEIPRAELLEKQQKQLQQLLAKHKNDLKLQQSAAAAKESATIAVQPKPLAKQMIVIKQNPSQIVAEAPKAEEATTQQQPAAAQPKPLASPLVILNKQQYQQQLQNSKHQIIQLSGQQLTAQQIQMLLKQQQALKRGQQQPQQIVMLKPDVQQSGQQIVMLKQQPTQQQLVMIKQAAQSGQKVQAKQQPQIIQITNSGNIVTSIASDLTKVGGIARRFSLLRGIDSNSRLISFVCKIYACSDTDLLLPDIVP